MPSFYRWASEAEAQEQRRARPYDPDKRALGVPLCGEGQHRCPRAYETGLPPAPPMLIPQRKMPLSVANYAEAGANFPSARPTLINLPQGCGRRTPYGAPRNSIDPQIVPGGFFLRRVRRGGSHGIRRLLAWHAIRAGSRAGGPAGVE